MHRRGTSALVLLLAACTEAAPSAESRLHQLYDEVWAEQQQRSVLLRVREGLPLGHLDDVSVEGARAATEKARQVLDRLDAIDLESVDHGEWVNAQALRWELETAIAGEPWLWHESVLTPYLSPLPGLRQVFRSISVDTPDGRTEYLGLLDQAPDFVHQLEERVRGQAERGIFVWRPNLATSIGLIRAHVGSAAEGPFAVPLL